MQQAREASGADQTRIYQPSASQPMIPHNYHTWHAHVSARTGPAGLHASAPRPQRPDRPTQPQLAAANLPPLLRP